MEMLKANAINRTVNKGNLDVLVKELKAGRWKVNGDTIRFTEDNILIDGQHRLLAVVRSGITIQTFVTYGLQADVFDSIDVGKRRSGGDTLSCLGEKNARRMSAALVMIDKYMTGRLQKSIVYSNTEIQGLLVKYPDIRITLKTTLNAKGLIVGSALDSCHYLFSKKDPVMTEIFIEKIFKGVGLEEGDPWYVLRERLLTNSMSTAKLSTEFMMALCIKAWNAARQGKQISHLKLNLIDGKLGNFPILL